MNRNSGTEAAACPTIAPLGTDRPAQGVVESAYDRVNPLPDPTLRPSETAPLDAQRAAPANDALTQAHPDQGCLIARTYGLMMVRGLQRFLDLPLVFQPFGRPREGAVAIVGWGLKGVAVKAKVAAGRYELPYLALEDGFLRSIAPGDGEPGLSLAIDDLGIYYDASAPSRLERQIAAGHDAAQRARATALAAAWRANRVSKYNHATPSSSSSTRRWATRPSSMAWPTRRASPACSRRRWTSTRTCA
jgi:hypothetical protein